MINGLSGILADIENKSVAPFSNTIFPGNCFGHKKQLPDQLFILRLKMINRKYVLFGYDQDMNRGLGFNIPESQNAFVFVNYV